MFVVLALLASSCSSGDDETGSDSEPPVTDQPAPGQQDPDDEAPADERDDDENAAPGGSVPTPPSSPPVHPALSELSGQLAIVDGGDVTVANPDGTGSAIVDGQSVRQAVAAQPVWSVDGARLAWATTEPTQVSVSVLGGETSEEIEVAASDGNPIFYLQWAPDGTKLAYLRNGPNGGVEAGEATVGLGLEPIDEGQPFYVSWSPSSDRLLAHVGSTSLGSGGEVLAYGDDLVEPDVLLRPTIGFTAPAWIDDTTFVGAIDGGLAIVDLETGAAENLVETQGPIRFVVSPDGSRIAYTAEPIGGLPDGEMMPLIVLDIETGQEVVALERDAIAWEWSPAGDRLAILGPERASGFEAVSFEPLAAFQGAEAFRWFFWDEQIFAATPAHVPSPLEAGAYLPFFEQFAQSHHRWSGDGVGFTFAGTIGGQTGIWVQIAEDETTASLVAAGSHVTWSPLSAAIGGGRSIQ